MRPDLHTFMMGIAQLASLRTTCIRRGVGCVLTNSRGHVLAVSYNGVASGLPHCNESYALTGADGSRQGFEHPHTCTGHNLAPGQDKCEAIHAEQNALIQCRDPFEIDTAYVTLSPCIPCMKLLLNTGCRRIIFLEEHSNTEAKEIWEKAGRKWLKLNESSAAILSTMRVELQREFHLS